MATGRLLEAAAPTVLLDRIEDLAARYRRRLRNQRSDLPGRLEVLMRAFHIMQYNLSRIRSQPSRTIEPEVGRFGWFDFQLAGEIMDEGYRAYREAGDAAVR